MCYILTPSMMPEYTYALYNFVPGHEDETAFEAGKHIEIIEKDHQ